MLDLDDLKKRAEATEKLITETKEYTENLKTLRGLEQGTMAKRRKYTDVITAADHALANLTTKEKDYIKIMDDSKKAILGKAKEMKNLTDEINNIEKANTILRKDFSKNASQIAENENKLIRLNNSLKDTSETFNDYSKNAEKASKKTYDISGAINKVASVQVELDKLSTVDISSQDEFNSLVNKNIELLKDKIDAQVDFNEYSAQEGEQYKKQLDTSEKILKIREKMLRSRVSPAASGMASDIAKEMSKGKTLAGAYSAKGSKLGEKKMGSILDLLRPGGGFKGKIKASESLDEVNTQFSHLNEVMSATGHDGKKMSSVLGMVGQKFQMLSKIKLAGWIGLAVQGIKMLANTVNDLDKFLKSYNKAFISMYGSTVGLRDVDKATTRFNDSIFDLKRNLKYGLQSEEIMAMFEGISGSGLSMKGLLENVQGGYNEVIERAKDIHLDFGVSMGEAGAMMSEQMMDLRMSVDEVSDGFKSMSYDAQLAGVQSKKFYEVTYSAAESLSYYGKFLDKASAMLRKFQVQGGMGFKDSQKQMSDTISLLKDMDTNSAAVFITMTGGIEEWRKITERELSRIQKEYKKNRDSLETAREAHAGAVRRGDNEEIARIEEQIKVRQKAVDTNRRLLSKAESGFRSAMKGQIQDLAQHAGMYAEYTNELIGNRFKELRKRGVELFEGADAEIVLQLKQALGLSEQQARVHLDLLRNSKKAIEEINSSLADNISSVSEKDRKGIANIFDQYISGNKQGIDNLRKDLSQYSDMLDMEEVIRDFQRFPMAVRKLMSQGREMTAKAIEESTFESLKPINMTLENDMSEQQKRQEQLVQNMHTIEEMIGITKENAKYFLAGSDPQKAIAKASIVTAQRVGGILGTVQKWFRFATGDKSAAEGPRTDAEFREQRGEVLTDILRAIDVEKHKLKTSRTEDEKTASQSRLDMLYQERSKALGNFDHLLGEYIPKAAELAEKDIKIRNTNIKMSNRGYRSGSEDLFSQKTLDLGGGRNISSGDVEVARGVAPEVQDFKAVSDGIAMLSKGDVVVDGSKFAKGMMGERGEFMNTAINKLKGGGMMGSVTIPVTISIGSVNGDPEKFLRSIQPAIEQSFERMYYERQKRG